MKSLFKVARWSLAAFILAAGPAAATPAQAAVPFSAPFHFAAGTTPSSIAVGDLNGDGFKDIVTTDGGCPPPPPYTPPPPCVGTPSVWVRLGGPLGAFGPAIPYGVVGQPSSPVIGDFFGNGRQDVAFRTDDSIQILAGSPLGALPGAITLPLPKARIFGKLAVGDFNGDGVPDIAAADYNGAIELWLSNGHGGFDAPVSYPFGGGIHDLAVGDFNHDGKADLAVSWDQWVPNAFGGGSNYPQLSVLFGDGHGGFTSREDLTPPSTQPGWGELAVGDLNGDGNADIVDTAPAGQVTVYLGDGHGSFSAPIASAAPGSGDLVSPRLADFEGDGHLDIVLLDWQSGSCCSHSARVYELSGDGQGRFVDPQTGYTGGDTQELAVADFLRDGRPDVAALNSGYLYNGPQAATPAPNSGVSVFYNLSAPSWWPSAASWAWPSVLAQWASGQWPSQLTPWDINSWIPLPPLGAWGSLPSPLAGIASAGHHSPHARHPVSPAVLRHAGARRLPKWLTPHTVSTWAAAARKRERTTHSHPAHPRA